VGIAHLQGVIETDAFLRTNIPNIYAIGDVNGKFMLAHVASAEGMRAVENIAHPAQPLDYSAVPQCIYTEPEAAAVGLTESEAAENGYAVQVSRIPVTANGRALSEGCTKGFVKLVAEKSSGRILGAHILAPHASEYIAQCVSAVRYKATAPELTGLIYPHPSVSELILEASHGLFGHAIHI
jgi:dihydrolipoamide dehydrogenase